MSLGLLDVLDRIAKRGRMAWVRRMADTIDPHTRAQPLGIYLLNSSPPSPMGPFPCLLVRLERRNPVRKEPTIVVAQVYNGGVSFARVASTWTGPRQGLVRLDAAAPCVACREYSESAEAREIQPEPLAAGDQPLDGR